MRQAYVYHLDTQRITADDLGYFVENYSENIKTADAHDAFSRAKELAEEYHFPVTIQCGAMNINQVVYPDHTGYGK